MSGAPAECYVQGWDIKALISKKMAWLNRSGLHAQCATITPQMLAAGAVALEESIYEITSYSGLHLAEKVFLAMKEAEVESSNSNCSSRV